MKVLQSISYRIRAKALQELMPHSLMKFHLSRKIHYLTTEHNYQIGAYEFKYRSHDVNRYVLLRATMFVNNRATLINPSILHRREGGNEVSRCHSISYVVKNYFLLLPFGLTGAKPSSSTSTIGSGIDASPNCLTGAS